MPRSIWRVFFKTNSKSLRVIYHVAKSVSGKLTRVLCFTVCSIPYVQTGFSMILQMSSLFSKESLDFLLIIQYIFLTLSSSQHLLAEICDLHVNFAPRDKPRYFIAVLLGIRVFFLVSCGQRLCLVMKGIYIDLKTLMLILHFFSQCCSRLRCFSSFSGALTASASDNVNCCIIFNCCNKGVVGQQYVC